MSASEHAELCELMQLGIGQLLRRKNMQFPRMGTLVWCKIGLPRAMKDAGQIARACAKECPKPELN